MKNVFEISFIIFEKMSMNITMIIKMKDIQITINLARFEKVKYSQYFKCLGGSGLMSMIVFIMCDKLAKEQGIIG